MAQPAFRILWFAGLAANIGMWMSDVAAAWLMTSLTESPLLIALVQSASTLPVLLLGLPAGALADIFNRRRLYMITQLWLAAVALSMLVVLLVGHMTAPLLLLLVFANGMGLALRWPVFSAIVPEVVPRSHLPAAIALNSISMNASRIIGPILAGTLIASLGSAWVFGLNALLAITAALLTRSTRAEKAVSTLPNERIFSAIRVGIQYAWQSPRMHPILLRVFMFFMQTAAVISLLPLVARQLDGGNAATFTLLLAAMGTGAIGIALMLPRLRRAMSTDQILFRFILLLSFAMIVIAFAPNVVVATIGMMAAGMSWTTCANSLMVAAQLTLPNWMRARGIAITQMVVMGSTAIGAAVWGQTASMTSVPIALTIAAVGGAVLAVMSRKIRIAGIADGDAPRHSSYTFPILDPITDYHAGPVLLTIEYLIDPARAKEFTEVMRDSRRSHLRRGALSWDLFLDPTVPGRYIEHVIDESWVEHLRRLDRLAETDVALRERRFGFHIGAEPPRISRAIAVAT